MKSTIPKKIYHYIPDTNERKRQEKEVKQGNG